MVEASECHHEWQQVERPSTEAAVWYRCSKCQAYGWARVGTWKTRRGLAPLVQVRKCMGCKAVATHLHPKRGYRGEARWQCQACSKD